MASTYTPTAEQDQALGLFLSGNHLVVEAGAGTGKTSTLILMAEAARDRRGQYLAFNRSIVEEAKRRLPSTASSQTAHSLAFRAVGKRYAHRLNSKRQPSAKIARTLGLDPLKIRVGETYSYLAPGYLAGVAQRAIAAFCNSADETPGRQHVEYIEGLDFPDSEGRRTYTNNNLVRDALAPALRRAWADLTSIDGDLRFTHDCYLKMWELGDPEIQADYLMFDEAQDASPVMLSIVAQQEKHGTQLVYVGDSQQQIYGWRGAINALASLDAAERTFLTQSFRFGPAIAEVANGCLGHLDAALRIVGHAPIESWVGGMDAPRATLCRSNSEAVGRVIGAQAAGRKPYLVGEGKEIAAFARAVDQLRAEGWTPHPELACFSSWGQVKDYVDQDPQGSDLALMVKLVEEYTTETILAALESQIPEERSDLVVSTAHKAKGREWTSVQLAGDYPEPTPGESLAPEEWRLLYVAVTRAMIGLDIEGVLALTGPPAARVEIEDLDDEPEGYGFMRPDLG